MRMRESYNHNLCTSSRSSNEGISFVNNLLSVLTLTSLSSDNSPLSILPLDLVEEIFCRLPVKLLCQLRCICKSWNSLISDSKFAKKHLRHSTTRHIYFSTYSTRRIRSSVHHPRSHLLTSYPLDSLLTNEVTTDVTQFEYHPNNYGGNYYLRGSCNGILCIAEYKKNCILLCNPSLRKFKKLPPFEMPQGITESYVQTLYGFGYDHVNDNYKVVVVLNFRYTIGGILKYQTEVQVYTSGTGCWKNIGEFPFDAIQTKFTGKFVSGTINWLACKDLYRRRSPSCFIVSFDLENESFQEVPKPDYGNVDEKFVHLGVLRDCLCLIAGHDIWLMKEYQNKESWTKLFTVSYMQDPNKSYVLDSAIYNFEDKAIYFFEDDRMSWKIDTCKFAKFQNNRSSEISVESLILP